MIDFLVSQLIPNGVEVKARKEVFKNLDSE